MKKKENNTKKGLSKAQLNHWGSLHWLIRMKSEDVKNIGFFKLIWLQSKWQSFFWVQWELHQACPVFYVKVTLWGKQ